MFTLTMKIKENENSVDATLIISGKRGTQREAQMAAKFLAHLDMAKEYMVREREHLKEFAKYNKNETEESEG